MGGFCSMAPRRPTSAASIPASVTALQSRVSQHLARGILGIGGRSEAHGGLIGLVALGEVARDAGGIAEAEGQHARRRRIERAGVAHLLQLQRAAKDAHHVEGGRARGLVDQQDAAQLHEAGQPGPTSCPSDQAGLGVLRGGEGCTDLRSCSMRSPVATAASYLKCSSGVNRICSAPAIWRRRKPVAAELRPFWVSSSWAGSPMVEKKTVASRRSPLTSTPVMVMKPMRGSLRPRVRIFGELSLNELADPRRSRVGRHGPLPHLPRPSLRSSSPSLLASPSASARRAVAGIDAQAPVSDSGDPEVITPEGQHLRLAIEHGRQVRLFDGVENGVQALLHEVLLIANHRNADDAALPEVVIAHLGHRDVEASPGCAR